MASFSAADAAFTGFRVVRERPIIVAFLAALQLVVSIGFSLLMISMAGPALTQFQTVSATAQQDPTQSLKVLQQLAPMYLVMLPLSLVFYSVLYAAMNRAVLRPSESAFGYLRLGADELRQLGLLVLLLLFMLVVYMGAGIATIIVGAIVGMALAAVAKGLAALVIILLVIVGVVCPLAFVGVRLSLASAQTFATGRINLFGSWTLTKGHFLSILGTYLLALVLLVIMGLLAGLIIVAVAVTMSGGLSGLSTVLRPDMSSVGVYFTPARIIIAVLSALFTALFLPVWLTPPASIYQSLTAPYGTSTDGRPTTVDAIFS